MRKYTELSSRSVRIRMRNYTEFGFGTFRIDVPNYTEFESSSTTLRKHRIAIARGFLCLWIDRRKESWCRRPLRRCTVYDSLEVTFRGQCLRRRDGHSCLITIPLHRFHPFLPVRHFIPSGSGAGGAVPDLWKDGGAGFGMSGCGVLTKRIEKQCHEEGLTQRIAMSESCLPRRLERPLWVESGHCV